ncbi:hypothetical protein MLD38_009106 [Melastoma candidum]|uniref:Uncharacterized protein n=1 Tax=Melastoma candidum TaxID=119954 RepID=A0ACB9S501_9MYRT|nr:hypothetical protein MLD38_009106 [Melastoma candidum]
MSERDGNRSLFPLKSLQIGDLQSYLSELSIFLALESNKLYILVDNRPWLKNFGPRPAHLWQFMVTKSRLSPFANSKTRKKKKKGKQAHPKSNGSDPKKSRRWFRLIDAASLSHKRALLPVEKLKNSLLLSGELHRTLYGFIVFEVEWSSVRGINYLNELQTDTSLAIEAKLMKRWEFDGINQASNYISSWFSGTLDEKQTLIEYLDAAEGDIFYDAKEDVSWTNSTSCQSEIHQDEHSCEGSSPQFVPGAVDLCNPSGVNSNDEPHTPPPPKRRRLSKITSIGVEVQSPSGEQQLEEESVKNFETFLPDESDNSIESFLYKDVLILVRFNDPDLPSKLREIIVPDLRLLTLLESGLPSWVIFLQSYPGFCHLYRPWMCPLARALYVAISVITVMIGFYDLYKNVPVLKTTAAHLLGPLFEWIETWEMASRIKYLGTMLFLQNIEKSVRWFLTVVRAVRSSLSVFTQPLLEPFVELFQWFYPLWDVYMGAVVSLFSLIWALIGTSFCLVMDFLNLLFQPLWFVLSGIWTIGTCVLFPICWILGEIVHAPIRIILLVLDLVLFIWNCVYCSLVEIWMSISSLFQVALSSKQTMTAYQISKGSSLWKDIFSQVFRAIRSILNGLIAFLVACNRHRLSTYNYMQGLIHRGVRLAKRSCWSIALNPITLQVKWKVRRKLHVSKSVDWSMKIHEVAFSAAMILTSLTVEDDGNGNYRKVQ